jgi:hypothetical protein
MKHESIVAYNQANGEMIQQILLSYFMNFIGNAAAMSRSIPIASAKVSEADCLKNKCR